MSQPAAPEQTRPMTDEEVAQHYHRLRQEQSTVMSRLAELEGERHEHALVLDTLKPLDAGRVAHRLVGGALIKKTVGTVIPEVEFALAQIDAVLKTFNDQLMNKEKELDAFVTKYKITVSNKGGPGVPNGNAAQQDQAPAAGSRAGVLA